MPRTAAPADSQSAPGYDSVPVTPSDTVDLVDGACRGIYVGVAGDVTYDDASGRHASVLLKAAAVGYHPIGMKRIRLTGTVATNILALY